VRQRTINLDQTRAVTPAPRTNGSTPAAHDEVVHVDRSQWESRVRQFSDYSYRQSWAYGVALANRRGAVSEHVAIRRRGETIGLADVRIKNVPIIGGGLAFVSGGPLVRKVGNGGLDLERLDVATRALVREFVQRRGLTLRIVAPVGLAEENQSIAERLERAGFRRSEQGKPYRTVLLDIDRQLDQIRSSLHRHWRRHLNGAERNNLDVSFGTKPDRFEQVARMSEALCVRKGFELDLDARFFADVQRELHAQDRMLVGLVSQNGTPVAGNITAIQGEKPVYLVGASTEAGRNCKASYLMHWRTIELLRERGLRWYDLGGIDPVANPGVTSFKLRTNGFDVTGAGPFERPPDGLRGRLTDWAERAYVRRK
jgi:Acetyltransferase (GNAT) domain